MKSRYTRRTRPSLSKYKRTLMSYTCARISSKTGSGMTTYNSHTATYNTMTPLNNYKKDIYGLTPEEVQDRKICDTFHGVRLF